MKRKLFFGLLSVLVVLSLVFSGVNLGLGIAKIPNTNIETPVITIGLKPVEAASTIPDFVCGYTSVDVQLQAAVDSLPITGGVIEFVDTGIFDLDNAVFRAIENVEIRGRGYGTYFTNDGVTAIFIAGGNNWVFRDFRTDAGGVSLGATIGYEIQNCALGATYVAHYFDNGTVRADGLQSGDLTSGRIPIVGASGLLSDDADLQFIGGDTLDVANLAAPTGRSATYVIAASDAPANVKAQADEVLSATLNQVEINATIVALNATGIRQKLLLIGTFHCSTQVVALSYVDVECIGEIHVDTAAVNSQTNGVLFNNVTNATWTNVTVRRQGSAVAGNYYEGDAIVIQGTTDDSLKLINCRGINEAVNEHNLLIGIAFWLTSGNPVLEHCVGRAGGINAGVQDVGIMISYNSSPTLRDCEGYGGAGTTGAYNAGIWSEETSAPTLINCRGFGGGGNYAIGIAGYNTVVSDWIGCTGIGGDSGILCDGLGFYDANVTNAVGCTGIPGKVPGLGLNAGFGIRQNAAPRLTGCTGTTPIYNAGVWTYDPANNGRFRPFVGYGYQVYSMQIYPLTNNPGITIDIGTTIGGHEVAQNVDISVGTSNPQFELTRAFQVANSYLYATPSGALSGAVRIYYSVMYDITNTHALILETAGRPRIDSCTFIGNQLYGVVRTDAETVYCNWVISNSLIENTEPVNNLAIYCGGGAVSNLPVYNSTIVGSVWNLASFANGNTNTRTGFIYSGEVRTASGSLTAGNANAIGFAFHDPELQDIYVKKIVITVTTPGGTAGSHLDVGIADDATGTNRGTEFFNDLLLNTAQVNDSWVAGDGGTQTKWVFCQDNVSATDGWIVGQILDANAASLVGSYYIEYVGR
jgi:hypothetical protein